MNEKSQYRGDNLYSNEDISCLRFIVMKIIVVTVIKTLFCLLTATTIIMIARISPEWPKIVVYFLFCVMLLALFMSVLNFINIIQAIVSFMNLCSLSSYVLTSFTPLKKIKYRDYCNMCISLDDAKSYKYYCISPIKTDPHYYIYRAEEV